jgi:hypothetical protein
MPVAFIQEFPIGDRSTENYDFLVDKMQGVKPEGLLVHSAGFDDEAGVWRQVDIWESREQAERFLQQMTESVTSESLPRPDTAAEPPSRLGFYELHGFLTS